MYYVYALYSKELDTIYIGMTDDPDRRLKEHRPGKSSYTKRAKDWIRIHLEECETSDIARKREKQLKSGGGRKFLRSLLMKI